jgi:predicted PurR-regulated permease PerM
MSDLPSQASRGDGIDLHDRPPVTSTVGEVRRSGRVHPLIESAGSYSWRIIAIAIVVLGSLWLVRQLWVVLAAAIVALMLTRILIGPATWLRSRGLPGAISALVSMLAFFALLAAAGTLIGAAATDEFDQLGTTVDEAVTDVEDWLVDDAPFDVSRAQLQDFRTQLEERSGEWFRSSSGSLVSGAVVAFEVLAALLLAIITTFFLLKDGSRFQRLAVRALPERGRAVAPRLGARAWTTLGGYLRGAAMLGLVEGVIIGITLWLTGASLVVPVMVVTFLGAFIPFAGALVAGVIATLVALATAGFGAALIVAIVAIVVQQLDNDLLAPVIYGKALELHPLMILFSITAGSALFGPAGAVLAVPVTAVTLNVLNEYRTARAE